jgi:hypothetical protein
MSTELNDFSTMIDERFELTDTSEDEGLLDVIIAWFI